MQHEARVAECERLEDLLHAALDEKPRHARLKVQVHALLEVMVHVFEDEEEARRHGDDLAPARGARREWLIVIRGSLACQERRARACAPMLCDSIPPVRGARTSRNRTMLSWQRSLSIATSRRVVTGTPSSCASNRIRFSATMPGSWLWLRRETAVGAGDGGG